MRNRSMPPCTVIPELAYPDVDAASSWLCDAFGFGLRLRIGNHRAQLVIGDGAVVLTELKGGQEGAPADLSQAHALMVRVADVDRHCEHAMRSGATILRPPADQPYGERQYTARDLAGRLWTFSQTLTDVAPAEWGGSTGPDYREDR